MPSVSGADGAQLVDSDFVALARSWMRNPTGQLLNIVWMAYEEMISSLPDVDARDLERSITQCLEMRVHNVMTGDEPFYVQHGPFERETMKPPPAQPPQYDLAFVFQANETIMWPIEAKVLETPRKVARYVLDVQKNFLTCRYAPFSSSGAMLGYLLTGMPEEVFVTIAGKLDCELELVPEHVAKPIRLSKHTRKVPPGKPYPVKFDCYHVILEYHGLRRAA